MTQERHDAGDAEGKLGTGPMPEPVVTMTAAFRAKAQEEGVEVSSARGRIAAICSLEILAQMEEASPILLMPAEPSDEDAGVLRGFLLAVGISPEAAPG